MVSESHIQLCSKAALLIVFGWNIALFTRALRDGFTRPNGVHPAMRTLGICGAAATILNAWLIVKTQTPLVAVIISLAVLFISQLVFRAAVKATAQHKLSLAFSSDTPGHLNQSGIYRIIRHPFYLAYALTWLAAAIASLHWLALIALVVMFSFYLSAAMLEERKFLASPLAPAYRAYRQNTGMIFPKLFTHKTNQPTN
jgi:protein-S-isoprenylcysteine O-methyltransferase Ste14